MYDEFKKCKCGILICTDIGSRGLDFEDTKIIILFDIANSLKDYINRVGRTARIGKEGAAISLLYFQENDYGNMLKNSCNANVLELSMIETIFRN